MTSFIEPNMFDHIAERSIARNVGHAVKHIAPKLSARAVMARIRDCAAAITLKKNPTVYSA
jgi:hypothetical protein